MLKSEIYQQVDMNLLLSYWVTLASQSPPDPPALYLPSLPSAVERMATSAVST